MLQFDRNAVRSIAWEIFDYAERMDRNNDEKSEESMYESVKTLATVLRRYYPYEMNGNREDYKILFDLELSVYNKKQKQVQNNVLALIELTK